MEVRLEVGSLDLLTGVFSWGNINKEEKETDNLHIKGSVDMDISFYSADIKLYMCHVVS